MRAHVLHEEVRALRLRQARREQRVHADLRKHEERLCEQNTLKHIVKYLKHS